MLLSCKESPSSVEEINNTKSTLSEPSLGGLEGDISLYFYDFSYDVNAKFLNYTTSTEVSNPSIMNPREDTLNIRTYSDYTLQVSKDDFINQTIRKPFDETKDSVDINSDGQFNPDSIDGGIFIESTPWNYQYNPISKLKWDDERGRYNYNYGGLVTKKDTVRYNQFSTFSSYFDSLIYIAKIDSNITSISENTIIDTTEYSIDTEVVYVPDSDTTIVDTIKFTKRSVPANSFFLLRSADCNDDGSRTSAEVRVDIGSNECEALGAIYVEDSNTTAFCDRVNGKYDAAEIFLDLGEKDGSHSGDTYDNGWKSGDEPFQDRNCNNIRDEEEKIVGSASSCPSNTIYNATGGFCDTGNGIWDDQEWPDNAKDIVFLNISDNVIVDVDTLLSNWESNEPFFKLTSSFENLIVDYQSVSSPDPIALEEVDYEVPDTLDDGSITTRPRTVVIKAGTDSGWKYYKTDNLFFEYSAEVYKKINYQEIDKYETTYSNYVIEQTNSYCSISAYSSKESCVSAGNEWVEFGENYNILKQHWSKDGSTDWNYTALRSKPNRDIVSLTHPIFFKHFGFSSTGLWNWNSTNEEILFYTKGGFLREGESVFHDTVIIASTGDYLVETQYEVEKDEIYLPYTNWDLVGFGSAAEIVCKKDGSIVSDFNSCPDNYKISDCFKVTKTRIVTLIGNAVEFGTKSTKWVARDLDGDPLGIVKSSLELRWSEPYWESGEKWTEVSRWELMEISKTSRSSRTMNGLLSRFNSPIKLDKIGELEQFNFEPYFKYPTFDLHRLDLFIEK